VPFTLLSGSRAYKTRLAHLQSLVLQPPALDASRWLPRQAKNLLQPHNSLLPSQAVRTAKLLTQPEEIPARHPSLPDAVWGPKDLDRQKHHGDRAPKDLGRQNNHRARALKELGRRKHHKDPAPKDLGRQNHHGERMREP